MADEASRARAQRGPAMRTVRCSGIDHNEERQAVHSPVLRTAHQLFSLRKTFRLDISALLDERLQLEEFDFLLVEPSRGQGWRVDKNHKAEQAKKNCDRTLYYEDPPPPRVSTDALHLSYGGSEQARESAGHRGGTVENRDPGCDLVRHVPAGAQVYGPGKETSSTRDIFVSSRSRVKNGGGRRRRLTQNRQVETAQQPNQRSSGPDPLRSW